MGDGGQAPGPGKISIHLTDKMKTLISIQLLLLFGCVSSANKKEYKNTTKVCDKLYVEAYTVFGSGAFGGDIIAEYLTDSSNFRILIGTFDNYKEAISYKCTNDSVLIERFNTVSVDTNWTVTDRKILSLEMLRKERKFE